MNLSFKMTSDYSFFPNLISSMLEGALKTWSVVHKVSVLGGPHAYSHSCIVIQLLDMYFKKKKIKLSLIGKFPKALHSYYTKLNLFHLIFSNTLYLTVSLQNCFFHFLGLHFQLYSYHCLNLPIKRMHILVSYISFFTRSQRARTIVGLSILK